MNQHKHWHSRSHLLARLAGWARQARAVVRDCNQAAQRAAQLRMAADMYLTDPDRAPDTYAEFLFRTSGSLRREPRPAGPPSASSSTRSL